VQRLRPRVLCVDDNLDVADSTAELLQLLGFEAVACYDGPHALEIAPTFRPDVCLLDLNMPRQDGDELAGQLRELAADRGVLFIAVTARGDDAARRRTAEAGFVIHLVKPVDPRDLPRLLVTLWAVAGVGSPPPEPDPSGPG
jgi:two-component system, OmpR family, response regulator